MPAYKEFIIESITVPAPLEDTWKVADNPRKLVSSVPMLARFHGPESICAGSQLAEVHTILGWRQRFQGFVTVFKPLERWAMTSSPVTRGPAPLPHDVEYIFERVQNGTHLTIRCDYIRGGLLRLPLGRQFVSIFMRFTIRRLLRQISEMARTSSNSRLLSNYV